MKETNEEINNNENNFNIPKNESPSQNMLDENKNVDHKYNFNNKKNFNFFYFIIISIINLTLITVTISEFFLRHKNNYLITIFDYITDISIIFVFIISLLYFFK